MTLAEKILQLRRQHGLSQEELAQKLGVSRQAVSRWELGSATPDAGNLLQLSRLLEVSADFLLHDEWDSDPIQSPQPSQPPVPYRRSLTVLGICAAALGALGNLAIYVASRFVPVLVPIISYDASGETWYTWTGDHTGYSYKWFLATYHLELLTALLWLVTAAGLVLLFRRQLKKLKDRYQRK